MEKLLLKPSEVAEALGVGRTTAYALIRAGALPSVQVGGSVRVPAEALRRWVEKAGASLTAARHAAPVTHRGDAEPEGSR